MASATKIMMISESPNIPKVYFSDPTVLATSFDKVLGFIVTVFDYMLGMVMGGIGGWVIGYCLGHIFLDMFEPVRLASFEAIEYWYYLPLTFGRYGAMIAAGISVPVAYFLSKRRRRCQANKELERFSQEQSVHHQEYRVRKSGFSLIEILVVIAVLALIMSILTPALCKAKEQARQMVCQSNLRQQGTLMMAYAADNSETYPVAPRYYPFGGLINWKNRTCWMRTYEPASQMALYINGYVDDPGIFYCPSAKAGTANYITQEDHWDKPAQLHPESDRAFLRYFKTHVTYATWAGYGYDTTGEPTISRYQPRPEDMRLIQRRATQNAMSRGDTILLSDIVLESMNSDAPKLNNHSRQGESVGGNIQYNDGSVRWNRFNETEALLDMPTIKSCFRL